MPLESARLDRTAPDRFVRLRDALGVTSFGINEMLLRPGQQGRIHRHREQEEVYLVLEGTLTIETEDGAERFGPDELVRVPAQTRRRLMNRGGDTVVLLALGGHGEHVGRDGEAFTSWEDDEPKRPQDVDLPADLR